MNNEKRRLKLKTVEQSRVCEGNLVGGSMVERISIKIGVDWGADMGKGGGGKCLKFKLNGKP